MDSMLACRNRNRASHVSDVSRDRYDGCSQGLRRSAPWSEPSSASLVRAARVVLSMASFVALSLMLKAPV
jgi:hypothetical protein